MNTAIGILADEDGIASDLGQSRRAWSSRASDYRNVQADRIPVDREHDGRWVGRVVHLERHAGNLWCVAEVDDAPGVYVRVGDERVFVESDLYWSVERTPFPDDVLIRSVALTAWPARVAAQPLTWFPGGLCDRRSWLLNKRRLDGHLGQLVERAGEERHRMFTRSAMTIYDPPTPMPALQRSNDGVVWADRGDGLEPISGPMLIRPSKILRVG